MPERAGVWSDYLTATLHAVHDFSTERVEAIHNEATSLLNQVSLKMDTLKEHDQIETVLDEVEYLFEVIPPELQDLAEPIIQDLRRRLSDCT